MTDMTSGTSVGSQKANTESGLTTAARDIIARPVTGFISPTVVTGLFRLTEIAAVTATGFAIYFIYIYGREGIDPQRLAALLAVPALLFLFFQSAGLYQLGALRKPLTMAGKLTLAWIAVFALWAFVAFFLKVGEENSRVVFGSWFVVGYLVIGAWRVAGAWLIREWTRDGRLKRRTVIVGGGHKAQTVIESLQQTAGDEIEICGIFDDRDDDRSPAYQSGLRKLGDIDELVTFGRQTRLDLLIVTLPLTAEARLLQMLKTLWVLPLDISIAGQNYKLRFRPRSYTFLGNVPLLDVFDRPIDGWDTILKWLFDRTIALLALIVLSPVMLAVAIAVKLESRGPIFFRQKRYGFNNELIEVFKFRSMYVDMSDADATKLVTKDDPRVTRVGSFIRKTSLDELPQLFNVLTGGLSLVGPRPHALAAKAANTLYDEVVDGYFARHKVRPGITGWAQVNGWRGETDTRLKLEKRVEHDLFYIDNWSIFFDLYILAITPLRLFKTENAY